MSSASSGSNTFAFNSRLNHRRGQLDLPIRHLSSSVDPATFNVGPLSLIFIRRFDAGSPHAGDSVSLGKTIAVVVVIAIIGIGIIAWILIAYQRTMLSEDHTTAFTRAGTWIRNRLSRRRLDPLLIRPTPFHLPESPTPVDCSPFPPPNGSTSLTRKATWVESAELRAASYHRDNAPVCIVLPDLHAAIKKRSHAYTYRSPNLSLPPAPRNRSSEHLSNLFSSNSASNIHRQSSIGVIWPIQSLDSGPVLSCPPARSSSVQPSRTLGLGLHIGQSTSWNISSESMDLAARKVNASLLLHQADQTHIQPCASLTAGTEHGSARKRKAGDGDVPDCHNDKSKRRALGSSPFGNHDDEQSTRYTDPAYADQRPSVLSEVQSAPSRSSFASGGGMEHFTDLFKQTMAFLYDREQEDKEVDPMLKQTESEEKSLSKESASLFSELTAPTALATDQACQSIRQPITAPTSDFHLPLRIVDCNRSRISLSSPRLCSGSCQIVKIKTRRTSLIPGMHISSASLDSDTSSTRHWTELTTSCSRRLFQDESGEISFSLNSSRTPLSPALRTYSEEEKEIDVAATRQLQHRQRSSSLSMTEPLYQQVQQSRFSGYTCTSKESIPSRYSQDSTSQDAFLLSPESPLDISHLRQLIFDINIRARRQTLMPCPHSRSASATSVSSIDSIYRLGSKDFRLSTFHTVPPLSFRQRMQTCTIDMAQCNADLSSETTVAMQLNRRSSNSSQEGINTSSRSSSNRDSDSFSPTMVMLELYQEERNCVALNSGLIEELFYGS